MPVTQGDLCEVSHNSRGNCSLCPLCSASPTQGDHLCRAGCSQNTCVRPSEEVQNLQCLLQLLQDCPVRALQFRGTTVPLAAAALRAPRMFPLLASRAVVAALLTIRSALGRTRSCCPESRAPGSCCACSCSALPGADFISLCNPGAALWAAEAHGAAPGPSLPTVPIRAFHKQAGSCCPAKPLSSSRSFPGASLLQRGSFEQ